MLDQDMLDQDFDNIYTGLQKFEILNSGQHSLSSYLLPELSHNFGSFFYSRPNIHCSKRTKGRGTLNKNFIVPT